MTRLKEQDYKRIEKIEEAAINVVAVIVACLALLLYLPAAVLYPTVRKLKHHRFTNRNIERVKVKLFSKLQY